MMFVKADELKEAFGVKQLTKLKTVLAQNKIPYFVNGAGQPITTQSALDKALGINKTEVKTDPESGFDMSWMDKQ